MSDFDLYLKKYLFIPLLWSKSYVLLFHAYMQPHSFSISNLVLAVPYIEIPEWITDLYTSKNFT